MSVTKLNFPDPASASVSSARAYFQSIAPQGAQLQLATREIFEQRSEWRATYYSAPPFPEYSIKNIGKVKSIFQPLCPGGAVTTVRITENINQEFIWTINFKKQNSKFRFSKLEATIRAFNKKSSSLITSCFSSKDLDFKNKDGETEETREGKLNSRRVYYKGINITTKLTNRSTLTRTSVNKILNITGLYTLKEFSKMIQTKFSEKPENYSNFIKSETNQIENKPDNILRTQTEKEETTPENSQDLSSSGHPSTEKKIEELKVNRTETTAIPLDYSTIERKYQLVRFDERKVFQSAIQYIALKNKNYPPVTSSKKIELKQTLRTANLPTKRQQLHSLLTEYCMIQKLGSSATLIREYNRHWMKLYNKQHPDRQPYCYNENTWIF